MDPLTARAIQSDAVAPNACRVHAPVAAGSADSVDVRSGVPTQSRRAPVTMNDERMSDHEETTQTTMDRGANRGARSRAVPRRLTSRRGMASSSSSSSSSCHIGEARGAPVPVAQPRPAAVLLSSSPVAIVVLVVAVPGPPPAVAAAAAPAVAAAAAAARPRRGGGAATRGQPLLSEVRRRHAAAPRRRPLRTRGAVQPAARAAGRQRGPARAARGHEADRRRREAGHGRRGRERLKALTAGSKAPRKALGPAEHARRRASRVAGAGAAPASAPG